MGVHPVMYMISDSMGCIGIDTLLMTVNACTGLETVYDSEFTLIPNPVRSGDAIQIEYANDPTRINKISIVTVDGKEVYHENYPSIIEKTILHPELPSGIYSIRIEHEKGVSVQKLIVM